jgi:hypothetical protein
MSLADTYRDNAADCAFLAERAKDEDTKHTLMRMEAAWRTLASKEFWTVSVGNRCPDRAAVFCQLCPMVSELRNEQTKSNIVRPIPNLRGAASAKPFGLYRQASS